MHWTLGGAEGSNPRCPRDIHRDGGFVDGLLQGAWKPWISALTRLPGLC